MSSDASPLDYFGSLAEGYDRHRPGYPPEVVDAALAGAPDAPVVVDLGAGTGIFARLLAASGARVLAVEPNAGMREVGLRSAVAGPGTIEWRGGRAEETGLPAACADRVTCAQAFHWFDAPAALAEISRILRPEGRLALAWNVRDCADAFTARYGEAVERAQREAALAGRVVERSRRADAAGSPLFRVEREVAVKHSVDHDLPGLLGRARSCSYWPPPGSLRDELERGLREAFGAHAHGGRCRLAYRCELALLAHEKRGRSPYSEKPAGRAGARGFF
jgi:SAM-dependent methyltransferase